MNLDKLNKALKGLTDGIDLQIEGVNVASTSAQAKIYEAILKSINNFELSDGRYVVNQDYGKRIMLIEKKMYSILGDIYTPSIAQYLNHYATIEDTNIALQKSYNDLEVAKNLLSPARKSIYDQTENALIAGIAPSYVQPVKYLLMQQVTQGMTIKDSLIALKHWDAGTLTRGMLATNTDIPNLQKYAGQIASDSAYAFNGAINNLIADKYNLDHGIYVGDVIEDTRPSCAYLCSLNRKISIHEIGALLAGKIPSDAVKFEKGRPFLSGLIPGTNEKNFPTLRMGYKCRHIWMPVKGNP